MIKTITVKVDDLDNKTTKNVETVAFALDGEHYEIELGTVHRSQLLATFEPYVKAARRTAGSRPAGHPKGKAHRPDPRMMQIRAWAQGKGLEVHPRGRIPARVIREFETQTA